MLCRAGFCSREVHPIRFAPSTEPHRFCPISVATKPFNRALRREACVTNRLMMYRRRCLQHEACVTNTDDDVAKELQGTASLHDHNLVDGAEATRRLHDHKATNASKQLSRIPCLRDQVLDEGEESVSLDQIITRRRFRQSDVDSCYGDLTCHHLVDGASCPQPA